MAEARLRAEGDHNSDALAVLDLVEARLPPFLRDGPKVRDQSLIRSELRHIRSETQVSIGRMRGVSANGKRDRQAYATELFRGLAEAVDRDLRARKAAKRASRPGALGRPTVVRDGKRYAKSLEGSTRATTQTLRTSVDDAFPEVGTPGAPTPKPRRAKHQAGRDDDA